MLIQESHVNASENYRLGEDEVTHIEDTVLDGMTVGEMYRWFQGEHGRCTGKIGVELKGGVDVFPVGWVFVKRDKYEDTGETFLHETWVMLLDKDETVRSVEYHVLASIT